MPHTSSLPHADDETKRPNRIRNPLKTDTPITPLATVSFCITINPRTSWAPILAPWCPDVLQDNGALFLLSSLPSFGPRRSSLLAFITREEGRGKRCERWWPASHTPQHPAGDHNPSLCLAGSFFYVASNARDAFLCTSYTLRRVWLHRTAIMDISNMLQLTRDRMRHYRQSNCSETTVRLAVGRYLLVSFVRCSYEICI